MDKKFLEGMIVSVVFLGIFFGINFYNKTQCSFNQEPTQVVTDVLTNYFKPEINQTKKMSCLLMGINPESSVSITVFKKVKTILFQDKSTLLGLIASS